MIKLSEDTVALISMELAAIPEKYQKPFNSAHEGFAVLYEEVIELQNEIFFGEKIIAKTLKSDDEFFTEDVSAIHKLRIKEEAIQVAAMACRIIQELTK